ncbi:malate dehydrogenase [Thermodesulfovibrionales bacterium]|nr:malate dehydrogenase [Thermodesulfovibrionales bacterium]MCL0061517.1 malate dehydrogenase [Thermodesulfovibrionales bacterium]MCL0068288.1 malate dehydrogenase [Thermodesulfovibrionales bacterium]MCL0072230.1 malate dehydrogenase [Thermodesulfovibrionales bacterium]MCL0096553.1 malate dehydrogenase [Thermodesulfovibrionales bacterium]
MKKRSKITIVGAGNVGATCAHWAVSKELGDIVLIDVAEGIPQGKALDLMEAAPIEGFDCQLTGTNDYTDTANSDLIIMTAGIARKPGMSRDDLLNTNAKIATEVAKNIAKYSPNACVICVSNPVDIITHITYKTTGFEPNRVMGMGGVLDSTRYRTFVALELGVSFEDISAFVLGGHGDDMVPLVRYTYAGGIPIEKLISREQIDAIVDRTRRGGAEIVGYLKTGSAYYAPAAAVIQMAEAVLKDKKRILPVSAYLQGEYGENDIFAGTPAIIGGNGMERIIEVDLTADEKVALDKSFQSVRKVMAAVK